MTPRTDRKFGAAIAAAFVLHILAIGVVSFHFAGSEAARPDPGGSIAVQFASLAAPLARALPRVQLPPPPKPAPQVVRVVPRNRPIPPDQVTDIRSHSASTRGYARQAHSASREPAAGVPGKVRRGGGELNLGSPSSHGDFNVAGGLTGMGSVPGTGTQGEGSGSGPGHGNTAPVGIGTREAPVAPPPPPAKPREVQVRVCTVSGMLPGPYCQHTAVRTFVDGNQPTQVCTVCKPPEKHPQEPAYVSRKADVVKQKLLSGPHPSIPDSAPSSVDAQVSCEYTVGVDGSVSGISVTKSSGIGVLDDEVVRTLRRWKYSPATQDRVPRAVRLRITFAFRR